MSAPMADVGMARLGDVWVYLAASPLLGLTLTLLAYGLAHRIFTACGAHPLANPVALAVALIGTLLWLTGTPYATYFEGAQFVHFLLGPATVALAVALHAHAPLLRRLWAPLLAGLVTGALAASLSAVALGWLLGASPQTLASLAPKSVTTPVAMGIAEGLGGLPSLTAVLVVSTGIWGAVTARPLFDRLGWRDPVVRGFALGVAAHGIGTARAFQVHPTMGAFAGLAMGLAALFNAVVLPWVLGPVLQWLRGTA
ncbi:Inner membrane protein YohK [Tepidimonas thermarum]|uniref:Inner membrane protein YohK n=1 Tax=Tepidimonas thermarum TaxID=335431 RepID=A0A554X485_9BURK|nr:LrgB family protein [Tepidimonas thermarum]TSE30654.1 Inner membrane protein YohK [Tepidimonas thermarum]